MNTLVRKAATLAIAAGALGAPFLTTQAQAGVVGCTTANVTIQQIRPADLVNCQLDTIGGCTFYYDPLEGRFPFDAVPETQWYVSCLAV